MNTFKEGDIIICINSGGYFLTKGASYLVKNTFERMVYVIDDLGRTTGFLYYRFTLGSSLPKNIPEEYKQYFTKR